MSLMQGLSLARFVRAADARALGGKGLEDVHMTQPEIAGTSPFFIVQDVSGALSFYRDRLGFEVTFQNPGDDVFFGIVRRGGAMIMFKGVGVDPTSKLQAEACSSLGRLSLRS